MKNNSIKNSFLNLIMFNGNKKTSEKLVIKSLKKLQKKFNQKNFNDLIKIGLINSSPIFLVKNIKRKRKQTVEFPFLLNYKLRLFYGIKFILRNCLNKQNQKFYNKLEQELVNSCNNLGQSVKIKKDLHKEAVVKKKFANYRWF